MERYEVKLIRPGGMGMPRYETTIEAFGQDRDDAIERAKKTWASDMLFPPSLIECESATFLDY